VEVEKMLKKIGIPALALLAMLVLASPPPAAAEVHFGVFVGPPAPAYPVYPGYYNAPVYPYPYVAPGYAYPGYAYPAYGYGYYGYGRGWRDHDRHYDYGHLRGDYRGHSFRGNESHRR
jgi:hypothetical protein